MPSGKDAQQTVAKMLEWSSQPKGQAYSQGVVEAVQKSIIKPDYRELRDLPGPDSVRLRYAPGSGEDLVISFASIGRRRAEMPPDEFRGTLLRRSDRHCLFVSDLNRSWLNDPDLCTLLSSTVHTLTQTADITRTTTIGLSQGGFSAMAASALFPVHAAVAISPQFSMMPKHIRNENRWRYWRKQIKHFRFETAEVTPAPSKSFAFHGLLDDVAHMTAFTRASGLDQFAFADQSHSSLGGHLRQTGILPDLLDAAIDHDRRRVARLVKSIGGNWRAALNPPPDL